MPAVPEPSPDGQLAPVVPMVTGREATDLLLGEQLRHWREQRGLKQKDLADVIRGSVSKISRLERGESPAKARDVIDLARFMRVSPREMRLIERLLEQAQDREWYDHFSDVTPTYLKRLISLEDNASEITAYENQVVPGLLQTRAYAHNLVSTVKRSETDVDRAVEVRMRRQIILDRPIPRVTALIDQGVLLRPRGGRAVMCEQLEHLLVAADTKRVNIRIVGFAEGADVSPPYAITHLMFGEGGPSELVYVEHINGADYVTSPSAVDEYRNALVKLRKAASDRNESKRLIREAIKNYS
ncbi:helix-turn-helix transcriptional regulator [Streptomyces scopuliridis]|nr:helix-turn-helix transcriptional regulator [Streptomyces scopuliridis]WSC04937.1 helix-turn-helix transcriptional regulator [Streptomyces scopuliridis]